MGAVCLFFCLVAAQLSCVERGVVARLRSDGALVDASSPDGGQPDGGQGGLRFTAVACEPNVLDGQAVAAGGLLECVFGVEGQAGRTVELSCESPEGDPLGCQQDWPPRWLQPGEPVALPVEDGWFGMVVDGPEPLPVGMVWVADDGLDRVRFELSWTIKTNNPPQIRLDCGGGGSMVTVVAGDLLQCALVTSDQDAGDVVYWTVALAQGPQPLMEPAPQWGEGPGEIPWAWQTASSEAGDTFVFRFFAHDSTAYAPHFDLMVIVQ